MIYKRTKILLIEDHMGDYRLIEEMLKDNDDFIFELEHADRLTSGLDSIAKNRKDIILMDLSLPDSIGIHTFYQVLAQTQETPIIVLTGLDNVNVAVKALREGAQDYLVKEKLDGDLLKRSIRFAIERHQVQEKMRSLSLIDELTSLYNRRGFLTLGKQQLAIHARMKKGFYLLFADIDFMKWINDTYGHQEGDFALITIAKILKKTFRASDIIARIGGDEFAVLFIQTESHNNNPAVLISRLRWNLREYNRMKIPRFTLSISIGVTNQNPNQPCSLDELLRRADDLMYIEKRNKKAFFPKEQKDENLE